MTPSPRLRSLVATAAGFFLLTAVFQPTSADYDPLRKAAKELADRLSRHKGAKVAVLAIPYYDNRQCPGPVLVSNRLTTYLASDPRLALVERDRIESILEEMHLTQTGLVDLKTTAAIGNALGADIVVSGTLIDLPDEKTEVNVRGLSCSSGRVLGASRAIINREWETQRTLRWWK